MPGKSNLTESEDTQAELLALKIAMGIILDAALSGIENREQVIETMAKGAAQIAAQLRLEGHDVAPERLDEYRALVGDRAASVIRGAKSIQRTRQRPQ